MKTKREITLVNQQEKTDCVAACIAMIVGVDINKVKKAAKEINLSFPMTNIDSVKLLCFFSVVGIMQTDESLYSGKIYKVGVASRNSVGLHSLIIDLRSKKIKVYDPQNGVYGKNFYSEKEIPENYFSPMEIIYLD